MQLSQKQKIFSTLIFAFSKLNLILKISKRKMTLITYVFFVVRTPKNVVRQMSTKSRFREPFHKYHGRRAETLVKAKQQHLCHVY